MPLLQIRLLGNVRVLYEGLPVEEFNFARLQEFLALLLLHRDAPLSRERIAYLFWPDSSEAQARTNLRKLWFRLRQALPDADRFLGGNNAVIHWRPDAPCEFDVASFEHHLQLSQTTKPEQAMHHLQAAAALYRGDLVPTCYSDWILGERERLRHAWLAALQRLAELAEKQRDYQGAIGYIRQFLLQDPTDEAGYRRLMELYALAHNRAGALRVYHECVDILARELDVLPDPITQELYERLLKAPPAPAPVSAAASRLIGQDEVYRTLASTWESVKRGGDRPRVLLLTGEPGIGKTRLALELVESVRRRGYTALTARCYRTTSQLSYAPVTDWLRALSLDGLPARHLSELARLVPELMDRHPDLAAPGPLQEGWQQLRFLTALTQAILHAPAPLLLLLDDLQWCDSETLNWLEHLLHHNSQYRLLLLGTVRREELTEDSPLGARLAAIPHLVERAILPLTQTDTGALASSVTGTPLQSNEVAALFNYTEGNPLFVIETLRAGWLEDWQESAKAGDGTQPLLPGRMRAVLEDRLNQLSSGAREVVGAAAVIGRDFTVHLLAQAVQFSDEELVTALDELWRRQLIREQKIGGYDFSHDKIREVAYEALSPARRRLLHYRVAEAMALRHGARAGAMSGQPHAAIINDSRGVEHADIIAQHFEQAGEQGRASHWYERAGEQAQSTYARETALYYYNRALALASEPSDVLWRRVGEVHQQLNQWEDAEESFRQALALAEQVGNQESIAASEHAIGDFYLFREDYELAREWLTRAEQRFEQLGDPLRLNQTKLRLARLAYREGDLSLSHRLYQRCSVVAKSLNDKPGLIQCYSGLANTMAAPAEAWPFEEQLLALAREMGDKRFIAVALHNMAGTQRDGFFDYLSARRLLRESLALFQEIGDTLGQHSPLMNLAVTATFEGDYEEALSFSMHALALGQELRHPWCAAVAQGVLGWIAWLQSRYDVAQGHLAEALSYQRGLNRVDALSTRAEIALEQGRYDEMRQLVDEIAALARPSGNIILINHWSIWQARVHLVNREMLQAVSVLEQSLAQARAESLVTWPLYHNLYWLATCHVVCGDNELANPMLDECLSLGQQMAVPLAIANSQHLRGQALAAQGRWAEAREELAQSLQHRHRLRHFWRVAQVFSCLAGLLLSERADVHAATRAVALLAAAEAMLARLGAVMPPYGISSHHLAIETARSILTDESFNTAWGRGEALSGEAALVFALECAGNPTARPDDLALSIPG